MSYKVYVTNLYFICKHQIVAYTNFNFFKFYQKFSGSGAKDDKVNYLFGQGKKLLYVTSPRTCVNQTPLCNS